MSRPKLRPPYWVIAKPANGPADWRSYLSYGPIQEGNVEIFLFHRRQAFAIRYLTRRDAIDVARRHVNTRNGDGLRVVKVIARSQQGKNRMKKGSR